MRSLFFAGIASSGIIGGACVALIVTDPRFQPIEKDEVITIGVLMGAGFLSGVIGGAIGQNVT